jgi:hypothetical protein
MKKLLAIGLVSVVCMSAMAQTVARSYKFLPADVLSLEVTNAVAITNLMVPGVYSTNVTNTRYTNNYGTRFTLTNSTKNFLQDVPLWTRPDGGPIYTDTITNTYWNGPQSQAALSLTWYSASGANAAVTFVFTPIFDGVNASTVAGDAWTISFTPTASSLQTLVTNVPVYRWPGAVALRCKSISNADTDAASSVYLRDLSLNGFVPSR